MPSEQTREGFIKEFLGRANRADIWTAIMGYTVEPPERFRALELQEELLTERHVPKSNTFKELQSMEAWGMICRLEPTTGDHKSVFYVRTESPIWDLAEVAIGMVNRLFPDTGDKA